MLLSILLLSWLLKRFRQPYFIAYITAGILLGPHGLKLFKDVDTISPIGSLGLILQIFFIGAEIEIPALMKNMRTLILGTAVQLVLSILAVFLIGLQLP
jgi:CPA2 family monovalent cation:H+ antiporter-2